MVKVDQIVYVNFVVYHTHLLQMMCHLYFIRYVNFVLQTYCNWTVDDPICALIFCERSTYFLKLIVLILLKINLSVRNNFFNNHEHVFLRILVTNLCVLCSDIYAIPTMCTPYDQSRLNLVSEICLLNIFTFSAWGVTVIF